MLTEKKDGEMLSEPEHKEEPKEELVHTLLVELKETLASLDRAVTNKETRTVSKLAKRVRKYRNIIKAHHIIAIFQSLGLPCPIEQLQRSKDYNPTFNQKFDVTKAMISKIVRTLQLQAFLRLLVIEIWWRQGMLAECLLISNELIDRITQANRRTLDVYSALLQYYIVRINEKRGTELEIRAGLLEAYNRACVRGDEISKCTVLNLLLRNYLRQNHIEAAHNLIDKTFFPENKSNNEYCKYLYYTGKVKAIRREYSESLSRLNQAIRKSPDSAKGFKIQCQKIAIVVQLLQGDIPNREIFSDASMFVNLYPYYKLIQVVLEGQLSNFNKVVKLYSDTYHRDHLYTIVLRLNQIVIRIGLRRISLAYSRISLKDIACKLNIPHEDVQFVVAKALRDGIMNGEIDHEAHLLNIEGDQNIYVTNQPQIGLNKRIQYCLNLYHEVQKAITYPDMRAKVEEAKEEELDATELISLLEFDDEM